MNLVEKSRGYSQPASPQASKWKAECSPGHARTWPFCGFPIQPSHTLNCAQCAQPVFIMAIFQWKIQWKKNTTTGQLVVVVLTNLEKSWSESQWEGWQWWHPIYILWKIKFMFQTTNQRKIWGPDGPMGPPWDHGTMVSRTAESRLCVWVPAAVPRGLWAAGMDTS